MALFKEITDKKGITTRYHKIGKMSIIKHTPKDEADERSHLICANVQSYASEDYRRADANNAIYSRDFHIFATLDEITETPVLSLVYNKLKALPTFDGAADC